VAPHRGSRWSLDPCRKAKSTSLENRTPSLRLLDWGEHHQELRTARYLNDASAEHSATFLTQNDADSATEGCPFMGGISFQV
jgi:hypothetical protein